MYADHAISRPLVHPANEMLPQPHLHGNVMPIHHRDPSLGSMMGNQAIGVRSIQMAPSTSLPVQASWAPYCPPDRQPLNQYQPPQQHYPPGAPRPLHFAAPPPQALAPSLHPIRSQSSNGSAPYPPNPPNPNLGQQQKHQAQQQQIQKHQAGQWQGGLGQTAVKENRAPQSLKSSSVAAFPSYQIAPPGPSVSWKKHPLPFVPLAHPKAQEVGGNLGSSTSQHQHPHSCPQLRPPIMSASGCSLNAPLPSTLPSTRSLHPGNMIDHAAQPHSMSQQQPTQTQVWGPSPSDLQGRGQRVWQGQSQHQLSHAQIQQGQSQHQLSHAPVQQAQNQHQLSHAPSGWRRDGRVEAKRGAEQAVTRSPARDGRHIGVIGCEGGVPMQYVSSGPCTYNSSSFAGATDPYALPPTSAPGPFIHPLRTAPPVAASTSAEGSSCRQTTLHEFIRQDGCYQQKQAPSTSLQAPLTHGMQSEPSGCKRDCSNPLVSPPLSGLAVAPPLIEGRSEDHQCDQSRANAVTHLQQIRPLAPPQQQQQQQQRHALWEALQHEMVVIEDDKVARDFLAGRCGPWGEPSVRPPMLTHREEAPGIPIDPDTAR